MTEPLKRNGYTIAQRRKMCTGKFRFADEMTVIAQGLRSLETIDNGTKKLYYYKCKLCKGWHLTKTSYNNHGPIMLEEKAAA
jgi:3-methyladenine DNA glycosylase AlkD